jgi:hypothetical protein
MGNNACLGLWVLAFARTTGDVIRFTAEAIEDASSSGSREAWSALHARAKLPRDVLHALEQQIRRARPQRVG